MTTSTFDLFRVSRAKQEVGMSANLIYAFARAGLQIYRQGKTSFVSRTELEQFIKTNKKPIKVNK